ncbi:uncharacterized protein TM35_000081240 [Trypanosoma theileri]|uniref:Uncharacterized protein n=1 Tax=Trypanosoma theileri TaxID=67003 RepID=A0A1X0P051_9TRYP|nr:uncharacterized protein TM35_000081240 [Trypanosoma theileri]ORC90326.1 hypothetical protein TM35_000081240 [Trypanosoma theileri]
MVSVSKLVQVLSRLVVNPQPMFTARHAQVLLRSIPCFSLNERTREDTLNMMKLVSRCPHASEIFAQQSQICERILTTFFVERYMDDNEIEEALREVIRVVSVNTNLSIAHLLTMIRRLSYKSVQMNGSRKEVTSAMERDEALANNLLLRVINVMPKNGAQLRENGSNNFLSQKEMHKRRGTAFEKPELLFLISTLRHITATRIVNLKDSDKSIQEQQQQQQQVHTLLPSTVVESVLQCIETLPMIRYDNNVPLREDDWVLIVYLIACNEPKLHELGRRLWLQNISQLDLKKMNSYTRIPFANMLSKFLLGLRGNTKRNALILWIDIVTRPDTLMMMKSKQIHYLVLDITICTQTPMNDENGVHKSLIEGGLRAVNTLESIAPAVAVHTRLMFTRVCPLLQTPEELIKTTKQLNEILIAREKPGPNLIREVSDFLRYVRRKDQVDNKTYFAVIISLAEYVLDLLERSPSLDQDYTTALLPAFTTFASTLRSLEVMESISTEKEKEKEKEKVDKKETFNLLRNLLEKISDAFLRHHTLQSETSLISILLQIMELLGFASNTQYTTAVRELVISAFRAAPSKKEDDPFINSAQNCYDLLLRSIHFHVVDAEVLSAAFTAVRHCTDATALRNMSWEQRALMLDRAAAVYRDISHLLPTVKEARRLAKHMLSVAAVVASEKVPTRTPRPHLEKSQEEVERKFMRRCAQTMWSLVLRVSLTPIPRTPVDHYLTPLLRFASRHWVAAELISGKKKSKEKEEKVLLDGELSQEIMDVMLPVLHQVMVTVFTDRATFFANIRRNRLILETACEILHRNRHYIAPSVWLNVQRTILYMPPPHSSLHTAVMRLSLKNALLHIKTCGDATTVIDPKGIADMFSFSDLIDDVELRVYLITLAEEQLEKMEEGRLLKDGENTTEPTSEEKALLIGFNKILSTLRRGSVLYY